MFTVLIVEDNKIVNQSIVEMMDWEALSTVVAGSAYDGAQGLKMALELKPNFVITDVDMPKMNGIEMTREILKVLPGTKTVFISCFDDFQYIKNAMSLKAYQYILKPIKYEELSETILALSRIETESLRTGKLLEQLKKEMFNNLDMMQAQFFKDLIYGQIPEKEMAERMDLLQISLHKRYCAAYFEIDQKSGEPGENGETGARGIESQLLLKEGLKDCVKRNMPPAVAAPYLIHELYAGLVYVLCFDRPEDETDDLFTHLEAIQKQMAIHFDNTVTVVLGQYTRDVYSLKEQADRVMRAAKSKFYSGGNQIIYSEEVMAENEITEFNIGNIYDKVNGLFKTDGDIDVFMDAFYPKNKILGSDYARSLSYTVATVVQLLLMERGTSLDGVFGNNVNVFEKIMKFETILDIRQWMKNVLTYVQSALFQSENNRYKSIAADIRRIIREKYSSSMSVEEMIKDLYLSPGHANYIFKQQTGKSIFSYLIEVRIEEAKRLLSDPYCKVYEVAEKVGYTNRSYFISVFKEYTGFTPKQYAGAIK
ncbi:MAG: response regulator [Firmicutes bacterium]|nr:response regulator [Bacillota bacterium]